MCKREGMGKMGQAKKMIYPEIDNKIRELSIIVF